MSIGELGMRNVVSLHCDSEREVAHGSHGFHGFFFVASNGLIHINSHSKENMHELGFNFLYPMLLAITVYASSAEFLLGSFHPLQAFLMVLMVNARENDGTIAAGTLCYILLTRF